MSFSIFSSFALLFLTTIKLKGLPLEIIIIIISIPCLFSCHLILPIQSGVNFILEYDYHNYWHTILLNRLIVAFLYGLVTIGEYVDLILI